MHKYKVGTTNIWFPKFSEYKYGCKAPSISTHTHTHTQYKSMAPIHDFQIFEYKYKHGWKKLGHWEVHSWENLATGRSFTPLVHEKTKLWTIWLPSCKINNCLSHEYVYKYTHKYKYTVGIHDFQISCVQSYEYKWEYQKCTQVHCWVHL